MRDKRNRSTLVWCTCGMLRGQEVSWIMIVSRMYWLTTRLLSEQFHSLNLSSCQENSLHYLEMMMRARIPHDRHTMWHKSTGNAVQCECTTVRCVMQCNSVPQPCCTCYAGNTIVHVTHQWYRHTHYTQCWGWAGVWLRGHPLLLTQIHQRVVPVFNLEFENYSF